MAWMPPTNVAAAPLLLPPPGGKNPFIVRNEGAGGGGHVAPPSQASNGVLQDLTAGGANLAHIHPTIKKAMGKYHNKFGGRAMIFRLLIAANAKMSDLPKLNHLIDPASGRNHLCNNHLLGVCPYGDACNFAKNKGHLHTTEVQDDFATNLVQLPQPGIAWMLANGPPPSRQDTSGGTHSYRGRGGGRLGKRPRTP
jgi:hypothetical protein